MRKRSLLGMAVALCATAPMLLSCAGGEGSGTLTKARSVTLVVQQAIPELTPVDNDPVGPSVGDRLEFVAALSIDGRAVGELTGVLTVAKVGSDSGSSVVKEERTGVLTFGLGGTASLTVNGNSKYDPGKKEMKPGEPQVRVVTGGTGAYEGAKGTASTVRNADGTYTHTFELKLVS